MKRFVSFVLALALCVSVLCSCGEQKDEEVLSLIRTSAEQWKEKDAYSADFLVNMQAQFLEYTLLFAQGSYTVFLSESGKTLDAKMSQVSLGNAAEVTVSWENGVMTSSAAGTEVKSEMSEEELFSSMTYVKPFVPDDAHISSCEKVTTGAGSGCKVKLKKPLDVLYPLVGEDIFALASIYSPRYDMTEITDAEMIYTLDGDNITGMKISFVLTLYDTPPYVPGGKEPDADDYSISINVSFNVNYKN